MYAGYGIRKSRRIQIKINIKLKQQIKKCYKRHLAF